MLQVTGATGSAMQVRALVSAVDAPKLWDLRCFVREHLVGWVRDQHPSALPRMRAELTSSTMFNQESGSQPTPDGDSRVFSQSVDGRARAETFGPVPPTPPA